MNCHVNMSLNDLEGGRGRAAGGGDTFSCPAHSGGSYGPKSPPAELVDFVRAHPNREVAADLGLALGTVYRLKGGYWPSDSRKIMQAWGRYKGRSVERATSWFIRRVSASGVRHGGKLYQAPQLAGRSGELLAVARVADGGMLAQSLELPAERFVLSVLQG